MSRYFAKYLATILVMFRTRDFLLLCAVVGFLLVAIILTLLNSLDISESPDLLFNDEIDSTTASYTAVAIVLADERESRLEAMRRKLNDTVIEISAQPVIEEPPKILETATTSTTDTGTTKPVDLCSNQRLVTMTFSTSPLLYAEIENQRVFYINVADALVGSSTDQTYTKQVKFRLPSRTQTVSFSSCISSPVVAITQTGQPIRNSDYQRYQSLPEGVLIGYTLDGFELYSKSLIATDACGGVSIGGVYRYYLSAERAGVLGCFMGIPVVL